MVKVTSSDARNGALPVRLKQLRRQRDLTLDALANSTSLTKSYLSKIERGLSVPSLATVLKLAEAFKLSVGQLIGEDATSEIVCVTRQGERVAFSRERDRDGYTYEAIAAARKVRLMEPFIMRPPRRSAEDNVQVEHSGEEFIFVLSGTIEIAIGEQVIRLAAGDAIYFDSSMPHRSRSVGRKRAEALVVACKLT